MALTATHEANGVCPPWHSLFITKGWKFNYQTSYYQLCKKGSVKCLVSWRGGSRCHEQLFRACSCVYYWQGMESGRCHRDGVNRRRSRKPGSIVDSTRYVIRTGRKDKLCWQFIVTGMSTPFRFLRSQQQLAVSSTKSASDPSLFL
jgi:hypothetical protein